MSTPDPHRATVYEAEGMLAALIDRRDSFPIVEAYGSQLVVPADRKFGDVASVQRYVDAVLALDWVRRLSPQRAGLPVVVRARAGAAKAEYDNHTHTIALPSHRVGGRWAMRELVVLHELAHHLSPGVEHGPAFVRVMIELVEEQIGVEAGFLLRSAFSAGTAAAGRSDAR